MLRKTMVLGTALVMLTACTDADGTRNNLGLGAVLGGATGAAVGGLATGGGTTGILVGAAVGAVVGGAAGAYMDRQEAALQQQMAGTGVGVSRLGDTIKLDLPAGVAFASGESRITSEFRPTLDRAVQVLVDYPESVIDVHGHTDTVGGSDFNLRLSQDRARSVADYMSLSGVALNRISPRGYGETQLAVFTGDGVDEPRNRRVELFIRPLQ